ncbi:MAG TPA: L-histidine N(alpha)-methyltransferase [Pyrinomonadaceae bacterium]|nr:L-histidine N(alpha)-methyltransferase [Pyrinomonadaceae bacterium]
MKGSTTTELSQFADDVLRGLSATPKELSSKYFYDDEGSRLFQEIMKLPEYYLTGCENEIFSTQTSEIHRAFANGDNAFDLIELGAGDGTKTAVLVDHFLKQNADISYSPIDISQEALDALTEKFEREFPALRMNAMNGDYFKILESLRSANGRRKVLLFLGSNIGNFSAEQSVAFFRSLREVMSDNDLLLVGFDLQKDPHVIANAYDDAAGVTAKFNLNLLTRINRELGGNFDLGKFTHYANYRPIEGSARSFLVSREKQTVRIDALGRDFEFDPWEAVFMEISQKYSLKMIEELAKNSGFKVKQNFFDDKNYYCDSLWRPAR